MGKIVVKIVSDGSNVSGGQVDVEMLRQYKADVVRLTTDIAETEVSGGVLPVTQAEYNAIVA